MYYHATQVEGIKVLEPSVSNHGKAFVYFSEKRENVLVYLSNAIEKFCKETDFKYDGKFTPWGPYSFGNDGIFELEEYYPNATYETYKEVSGYIYSVNDVVGIRKLNDIPGAFVTSEKTKVDSVEYIKDAYEEIIKASNEGKIRIIKFEDLSEKKQAWLRKIIQKEYNESSSTPDYKYFLENKFDFIKK